MEMFKWDACRLHRLLGKIFVVLCVVMLWDGSLPHARCMQCTPTQIWCFCACCMQQGANFVFILFTSFNHTKPNWQFWQRCNIMRIYSLRTEQRKWRKITNRVFQTSNFQDKTTRIIDKYINNSKNSMINTHFCFLFWNIAWFCTVKKKFFFFF